MPEKSPLLTTEQSNSATENLDTMPAGQINGIIAGGDRALRQGCRGFVKAKQRFGASRVE